MVDEQSDPHATEATAAGTPSDFDPEHVDPDIREAVQGVLNRYGTTGLEEMVALARHELVRAREALKQLGD